MAQVRKSEEILEDLQQVPPHILEAFLSGFKWISEQPGHFLLRVDKGDKDSPPLAELSTGSRWKASPAAATA